MWNTIVDIITANLTNVAIGVGIFVLSYLSNVCFGVWYNVQMLGENFDYKKLLKSALKILCLGAGIAFLTLAVTLIVPFAQENGLVIPDEYKDVIQVIAILSITLMASIKYIIEALEKFRKILQGDVTPVVETTNVIENKEIK